MLIPVSQMTPPPDCLYILEIKPLLDVSFANIFFQSVGWFFCCCLFV